MEQVGPDKVIRTARKFGIKSPLGRHLSLALGTSGISPLEIASAYSVIANLGIYNEPYLIQQIEDFQGNRLYEHFYQGVQQYGPDTLYPLLDMMRGVVERGTGKIVRRMGFQHPAAGKTGTTNNKTDAWFIGFTPELAIGVWVGIDSPEMKLGEKQYGSRAALPIFAKTINKIYSLGDFYYLNNSIPLNPKADWEIPEGVIKERICKETCCLQTDWCESYYEYFLEDNVPENQCEEYSNPLLRFK